MKLKRRVSAQCPKRVRRHVRPPPHSDSDISRGVTGCQLTPLVSRGLEILQAVGTGSGPLRLSSLLGAGAGDVATL